MLIFEAVADELLLLSAAARKLYWWPRSLVSSKKVLVLEKVKVKNTVPSFCDYRGNPISV